MLIGIGGLLLILLILWEGFETIVLPRRVVRKLRLTRLYYVRMWNIVQWTVGRMPAGKRRDKYLGIFGPLSLLLLFILWALALMLGYAMIQWALASPLNAVSGSTTFTSYLYLSGITFFTVGYGDLAPADALGRALAVLEAGTGLGFLAIVIGYLPVIYQAFSRREVTITMLDARTGSTSSAAELLRRYGDHDQLESIAQLLEEWEHWSADLLESHLSYPVLSYYRSQHDNQSWLAALVTILDTSALVITGVDGLPRWQAQLTFAMARHALVDIAQIFNAAPRTPAEERLPPADYERLRAVLAGAGVQLRADEAARRKLAELRQMYEPYAYTLACYLMMNLPPWVLAREVTDNWRTSAWGRISSGIEAPGFSQQDQDEDDHL